MAVHAGPRPGTDRHPAVPGVLAVLALLHAVVSAPFLWMVHLSLGPALAGWQCAHHTTWPINALTVVTSLAIASAMWLAWRIHRRARADVMSGGSLAVSFIALVGLLWGAISLLATILEGVPNLVGVASCPR